MFNRFCFKQHRHWLICTSVDVWKPARPQCRWCKAIKIAEQPLKTWGEHHFLFWAVAFTSMWAIYSHSVLCQDNVLYHFLAWNVDLHSSMQAHATPLGSSLQAVRVPSMAIWFSWVGNLRSAEIWYIICHTCIGALQLSFSATIRCACISSHGFFSKVAFRWMKWIPFVRFAF